MLGNILRNKVLSYIFSRYAIFALQFVNTLMIANLLTPFEFGVWGFTQMIIMYFSNFDLGIPSSFNALASIHKRSERFVTFNFNAAFTLTSIVCILIFVTFGFEGYFDIPIGIKYNFDSYLYSVMIIIILGHFNKLLMNLFRVYNKLKEITFFQAIVPITLCITYILFKDNLIQNILTGMIFANCLSLLFFLINSPLKIKINFSTRLLTQIQKSGIFFFIYNTSFYFIMLSTRTIISFFYSVEEFGLFNFALNLSNTIELSVSAFSFLIFPKMINRLSSSKNENALQTIYFIQSNYTLLVSILTYSAMAFFPIFIYLFPNYENSIKAFNLILLSNLIYANCFGSPVLLMARKKERKLALTAFSMLLLNITLLFFLRLFNVDYNEVIICLSITYTFYVLLVNRLLLLELNCYDSYKKLIIFTFPFNQIIPLIIGFIFSFTNIELFIYPLLIILFIVINFQSIIKLKKNIQQIILKQNLVDL